MKKRPMYMKDYINQLDNILSSTDEKVLEGTCHISHKNPLEKANQEYRKYQKNTFSPVEEDYLSTIKSIENK